MADEAGWRGRFEPLVNGCSWAGEGTALRYRDHKLCWFTGDLELLGSTPRRQLQLPSVVTLPYSQWTWATVCRSTAATHDLGAGKRDFNADYQEFMDHLGIKPRTIAVGKSNQNGPVEARNGA
ncbi:MAG: hypothetical protein AAGA48_19345 [Myxococcota bacterium]